MKVYFGYLNKNGMTTFNLLPYITYSRDKTMSDGRYIDIGWLFWNLCFWFGEEEYY